MQNLYSHYISNNNNFHLLINLKLCLHTVIADIEDWRGGVGLIVLTIGRFRETNNQKKKCSI